jgi:ABC-type lipoprotein release transport system permease subunit
MAISFGLFCLIVFQALKVGLHREMTDGTVLLETGSIQIHARGYESNLAALRPLADPEKVESTLRAVGIKYFSRRIRTPALLLSGIGSSAVILSGVDPATEPHVTCIASKLIAGKYLESDDKALVGSDLAGSLGIGPGGVITLMAQDILGRPLVGKFVIGGIFRTELSSYNRSRIFIPLAAAQKFLHLDGSVTEIVALTDSDLEEKIASSLSKMLSPTDYQVRSWHLIAPDLSQLIEMNDATMRLLILIVFSIVALGITNTMTMTVYERFHELGILAAIGTPPSGILTMLALESLFIGFLASMIGSVTGVLACRWLAVHGIDMTHFTSSNQYIAISHVIKAHLKPGDLLYSILVALVTSLLAGLYPAWRAARLEPVKAIGHI